MVHDFVLTNQADLTEWFLLLRADNATLVSDLWNSRDRDQKCNLPFLFTLLKIFRTVVLTVSNKNKGTYILESIFWDILL